MRKATVLVSAAAVAAFSACASEGGEEAANEPLSTDSTTPPVPSAPTGTEPTGADSSPGVTPPPAGGGGTSANGGGGDGPSQANAGTPGVTPPVGGASGTPATPNAGAPAGGAAPAAGGTPAANGGEAGTTTAGTPNGGGGGMSSAGGSSGGQTSGAGGATVDGAAFEVTVQLASEVDPNAPGTIGIVTWSTTSGTPTSAGIEFGLDTTYGTTAPVDLAEADFRTLLLGMKPAREYHFRVVAVVDGTTLASDDYTVETGPPTDLIDLAAFDVVDDAARERGFIVASYWQGPDGPIPFIIDADGEIVWWYESNSDGIARARMSADGKNMWIIVASNNGGPLERVTMDTLDGEVYMDTVGSHDLTPVSGELMAYLDYGESDCDSIFEIDPSGETREIFETEGVITMGCHANALRYSQAEDVYTLSDVSTDVLVLSREGELQWRLTDIVPTGNAAWGGTQHGHHLLENSIVIYANRFGGADESAALEYTLAGEEIFRYESGDFSANLGDVQRLPGGNTLVTYSNDSLIHEVDAEGNLVLEIDGGGDAMGYALWVDTLYGPPSDIGD